MPRSNALVVKVVLFAAIGFAGCGFAPAAPGGSGASGGPLGAGNSSGTALVGGGAAQNGQGAGTGMECAEFDQPLNRLPPDILIVLDASGSMNEDSSNNDCTDAAGMNIGCGANSKWGLLTPALNQVVSQTQAQVNWGVKLFADMGNQCGVNAATVAVPVGANNAAAIAGVIAGRTDANGNVTNGSYTPTRRAEDAALTYYATVNDPNAKYILLATDGQPNCQGTTNNTNDDTPGAVMAVANAAAAGFPTFVVGVSAPPGAANDALNMMAVAGGYARTASPQYYPVTSAAEFVAVLNTLVKIAGTCVFTIPPAPSPDTDPMHIIVKINGQPLTQDMTHTSGWDFTGTNQVEVYGSQCTAIMNGQVQSVQIVFKCRIG